MLRRPCPFVDEANRRLGLRPIHHSKGVRPALLRLKHGLHRLLPVHFEDVFKDVDHELHRREVIAKQLYDVIDARFSGLLHLEHS